MTICPTCGAKSVEGAVFCDECGAALQKPAPIPASSQAVVKNCPVCGAPNQHGGSFCENCGASLTAKGTQSPSVEAVLPPTVAIPEAQASPEAITAPGHAVIQPPSTPSSSVEQLTCPNCGAILENDSAFCDMCGTSVRAIQKNAGQAPVQSAPVVNNNVKPNIISGDDNQNYNPPTQFESASTQQYVASSQIQNNTPSQQYGQAVADPDTEHTPIGQKHTQPQSIFNATSHTQARLVITGTYASLPLPSSKREFIIGREDPIGNIFPDIDLTDFGGDEKGVSRQHACIRWQGNQYYIIDLQSTNFTYINQRKLQPNLATLLHDGDEIQCGKLKMIFHQS